jgi:hypothetical protein
MAFKIPGCDYKYVRIIGLKISGFRSQGHRKGNFGFRKVRILANKSPEINKNIQAGENFKIDTNRQCRTHTVLSICKCAY